MSPTITAHEEQPVTETRAASVIWLTQEAFDRLRGELDELSGPGRIEIAKKIEAAREEGDLRENGGYHAAKEEQGKREARIRQLSELLQNAKVGQAPTAAGEAGPGMVVTVRFPDAEQPERFLIGSREDSAHGDLEIYSAQSPLGMALTGKRPGQVATYRLPSGREVSVTLVEVEAYSG